MIAISASVITVSSFALVIDAIMQLVPSFGAVHYSQIPCVLVRGNVTSTHVFLSGRARLNPSRTAYKKQMVFFPQNAIPLSILCTVKNR